MFEIKSLEEYEKEEDFGLLLKIYGFPLNLERLKELIKKNKKKEDVISLNIKNYYASRSFLLRVEKIVVNERDSLKLLILSNGYLGLLNKSATTSDPPYFSRPYNKQETPIFEHIKEKEWLLFTKRWGSLDLVALTGITKEKEIQEWISLYSEIDRIFRRNQNVQEIQKKSGKEYELIIGLKELKDFLKELRDTLEEVKRLEEEEKRKRKEALTKKMKIIKTKERNILKLEALDDHTYCIGFPSSYKIDKEKFLPFVYRHRYQLGSYWLNAIKQSSFFEDIFSLLLLEKEEGDYTLKVDNSNEVNISFKEVNSSAGTYLTLYINNKRIAMDEGKKALYDYFFSNKALDIKTKNKKRDTKKIKTKAEILIEKGLHGRLEDLEGEYPVDIGLEKKGSKWYLVLGDNKIYLKGGMSSIEYLARVLEGRSLTWNSRFSTTEFYRRLSQAIGEETALEVINLTKKMGKLLKALK